MHSDGQASSQSIPDAVVMPLTVAQCHEAIQAQVRQIELLLQRVASHEAQMAVLQERLKLDSHNSSKPPSSDGPGRPNRAQRRVSQRKRGAQKGHPGSYRALLSEAQVNGVHDCFPAPLCDRGAQVPAQGKPVRYQKFDIPPVAVDVQAYRMSSGVCTGCGKAHRAVLPSGFLTGQIGPRSLARVGVLGTRYHLTRFKIRNLLAEMAGRDFSAGGISHAHGNVAAATKALAAELTQALRTPPVVHMDETSYPRER